ncbi:biotin-dependent carboxyltransferase family protein [Porticoccaceae bacterium]|jgi:biotin-dependent carboxylase-like uncharacterized protein|nr:biotin-dependent carboxyltransferase family protein [Porticoccaceae bacterium]
MMGFEVINPGMHCLLQDKGRVGYHSLGITSGGAFDQYSFGWANRLCLNDDNAGCIEILIGGLIIESQVSTQIAITGADIPIKINDSTVENWCTHNIQPGDKISFGYATAGCRSYLAIAGGIQAPLIFNSLSTVVREGLGGLTQLGTPLEKGDILTCSSNSHSMQRSVPAKYHCEFDTDIAEIRIVTGYQYEQFSQQTKQFFATDYVISPNSDRMGYRLEGPAIEMPRCEMLSEGISLGAVQLTADGMPIILLCDRQTIGGYPKLGSVFSLDIARLAQMMPGQKLCFKPLSIDQAQHLLQKSAP